MFSGGDHASRIPHALALIRIPNGGLSVDTLGTALTIALALIAAFFAALWAAGAVWAYQDIRARTQDIYVQLFAALLVLILGPFGAVLYLILRPRETLDDTYLRVLQEEAILREMNTNGRSPPGMHTINGKSPTLGRNVFVAPSAQLIGDVRLGDNVSVWYNTVIRADIAPVIVGPGTNIQDGSVLHVDVNTPLVIGANVSIGHMATVHGCTVDDECLVGIHSTVLSHAHIRRHSVVGAAALIPEGRDYPERSLLLGIPARLMREITEQEIDDMIIERAAEYRRYAATEIATRSAGNTRESYG